MQESKYIDDRQVLDVETTVDDTSGDVTLDVNTVRVNVDLKVASAAARTITLPNVSEARFRTISIRVRALGYSGSTLRVKDGGECAVPYDVNTFDAVGDRVVLWSDGASWNPIMQTIA